MLEKIERQDYSMYLGTSLTVPRTHGLQFRECACIAIFKSPTDPLRRCIFRQRYQLFSELVEARSGSNSEGIVHLGSRDNVDCMKQFLVNALATRMRSTMHTLEESLLQNFGGDIPIISVL